MIEKYNAKQTVSDTLARMVDDICHTSQRTPNGVIWTLEDARFPHLMGKKIRQELVHGKDVFSWLENVDLTRMTVENPPIWYQ